MPDLIGKAKDAMGKKEDKDAQPGNKVEGGADNAANDRMSSKCSFSLSVHLRTSSPSHGSDTHPPPNQYINTSLPKSYC